MKMFGNATEIHQQSQQFPVEAPEKLLANGLKSARDDGKFPLRFASGHPRT
jgi:hypothetical protein